MNLEGSRAVGLVLAVLVAGLVVDRAVGGAHLAVGLGLTACLLAVASAGGLTPADLGLARSTWAAGLRWGAAAGALIGLAYALAYLLAPVRQALQEGDGGIGRAALWTVLVVIPLGTVIPEELAFRGLLLALLGRSYGVLAATIISSGLYSACGMSCRRWAAARPTPRWPPWWAPTPPGRWSGSSSPWSSRRWPGSCSAGCGCAATAWSLPCWPIGRSTAWVSS